jgi:hypothetical protein
MRRGILALVLGLLAGYALGFSDAYRGEGTLGARVWSVFDKIHPDHVADQRARETAAFRQKIHEAAAVADSAP